MLIFIIKTVVSRRESLEASLGPVRAARLTRHTARGCPRVEKILTGWVAGVAADITSDPDTLVAVNILLSLFVTEARALQTDSREVIMEFCRNWTGRCIRRLMQGMGLKDLLVQGTRPGPKWGSRLVSQASSRFLVSLSNQ